MPKLKKRVKIPTTDGKPIEQYTHNGEDSFNNPPVGLATPETHKETGKKTYSYEPHLDPQASPITLAKTNRKNWTKNANRSWVV